MSQEHLWVGKLDKSKKELMFAPSESHEPPMSHNLLLKRVVLGPCKDGNDLNVLNIETAKSSYREDDVVDGVLCCLQASEQKQYDQCSLDILIPSGNIKFLLTEGRGPITIFGQHISEYIECNGEESDEDEEEEEEEEEEEKEEKEEVKIKKRKLNKSPGLGKKQGGGISFPIQQGGGMKMDYGNAKEEGDENKEESPAKPVKKKAAKAQKEIKIKNGKADAKKIK